MPRSCWLRTEIPTTVEAIRHRETELTFSAAFLREMRAIAQAREKLRKRVFALGNLERRLKGLNFHLIHADDLLGALRQSSQLNTRMEFLTMLREEGRAHADRWLGEHFDTIERGSSVDLNALFD